MLLTGGYRVDALLSYRGCCLYIGNDDIDRHVWGAVSAIKARSNPDSETILDATVSRETSKVLDAANRSGCLK